MSQAPRSSSHDRRPPRRNHWPIVLGVLVVLAAALAIAARDVLTEREAAPPPTAKPQAASESPAKPKPQAEAESNVIDDDGHSLWVSPTAGPPLDLRFMQSGVEIIVAIRPAAILSHLEGKKILTALGPAGDSTQEFVRRTTGLSLLEIDRLILGWRIEPHVGLVYTQLVFLATDNASEELIARLKRNLNFSYLDQNQTFVFSGERVFFMRDAGAGPQFVESTVRVFADFFPPEPLLPRDVERLTRRTDSDRDFTLVFRPQFLLSDQLDLLTDNWSPVRRSLDTMFGHNVGAVAVSFDWNEDFFAELMALPTLDSSPAELSRQLAKQVDAWPTAVEESVVAMNVSPYSRRVVARLPEMLRRLAAYTRHGYDRDAAILRCYLPVTAGHNLLMATELALAESQAPRDSPTGAAAPAEPGPPASIAERLKKRTTLRFGREELEAALHMLAEDVGVPITIRGQDLQLDGITRNQLFAIDLADRPAEEILVEILRRANPDKTATGPADTRQKLVYVVGADGIIITTRSQAAERGEALPTAFRAE
ncbi:MAG: hypothetical protein AB7U73_15655 [Pirellulales bacterium]